MLTPIKCKLVAYYRVSTDKQGKSGLGMEAQQHLIDFYGGMTGCTVINSFTEVESGKRNDRPELGKAIAAAKRLGARLVIAKLDRLGRNVHFISGLMETGVDFVAADSPNDDRFVLHMRAAFAEEEARKISERTKAALAALKARGVVLGKPENMTQGAREKGASVNRDAAITAYATLMPLIRQLRADGFSFGKIAERMNVEGRTTRQGAAWTSMAVKRVLDRV
jgi:DNA invertase Pin-like site-specific DNA recombinase